MRNIHSISLLLFLVYAGTIHLHAASKEYHITGTADARQNGQKVMLLRFKDEKVSSADTSVITDGKFKFKGQVDLPALAIISSGNYPDSVLSARLMLEPGQIDVSLGRRSHIGGTRLNDIYQSFLDKDAVFRDSILLTIEKKKNSSDHVNQLSTVLNDLRTRRNQAENDFLVENSANALGVILCKERLPDFEPNDFLDIYRRSDVLLQNEPYLKWCLKWFEQKGIKEKELKETQQSIVGKLYRDFIALNTSGKDVKLSDFMDNRKYTLVVFWASWCSPCMAEQPVIKEIYDSYKEKGLEVIGVSLDSDDANWKHAKGKINSNWTQLRCKGDSKLLYEAYGFQGIPCNTLIGKDGKIIASNLPHTIIKQYLNTLLK